MRITVGVLAVQADMAQRSDDHVVALLLRFGQMVDVDGFADDVADGHVVPVLYDDRFVQAVLLTHGLHCRCADGFLSDERSARHLLHEHEGQRRHDEQRQHPEQHSLENILSQN